MSPGDKYDSREEVSSKTKMKPGGVGIMRSVRVRVRVRVSWGHEIGVRYRQVTWRC